MPFIVILMFLNFLITGHCTEQLKSDIENQEKESKRFNWTFELKSDLLKAFYETDPDKKNHSYRLHDCWIEIHPEHSKMSRRYLAVQARYLVNSLRANLSKEKGNGEPETNKKRFKWSRKLSGELLKIYHETTPGKKHSRRIHNSWVKLHPEFSDHTASQLKKHLDVLLKRRPATVRSSRKKVSQKLNNTMSFEKAYDQEVQNHLSEYMEAHSQQQQQQQQQEEENEHQQQQQQQQQEEESIHITGEPSLSGQKYQEHLKLEDYAALLNNSKYLPFYEPHYVSDSHNFKSKPSI